MFEKIRKYYRNKPHNHIIRFHKAMTPAPTMGKGAYTEIRGGALVSAMKELQQEYDFEIVSVNFQYKCSITIRSKGTDHLKIFAKFVTSMAHYIERVNY